MCIQYGRPVCSLRKLRSVASASKINWNRAHDDDSQTNLIDGTDSFGEFSNVLNKKKEKEREENVNSLPVMSPAMAAIEARTSYWA